MLTRYTAASYVFFQSRRPVLFAAVILACLACAVIASRLVVREDVRALLPSEPKRLAESFTLLREAPFMRRLSITVGGAGHDPIVLADAFAEALRSEEIPRVITGPGVSPSPAMLAALCDVLPSLLNAEELPAFEPVLAPSAMRASLEADKRTLLTPQGLALRSLVAKDPLGLRNVLFKRLASSGGANFSGSGGARLHEGHIVDVSGRYAMVLAEPASSMSDSAAARVVMARVEKAAASLPADAEVIVVGAYRHTDVNASAVKDDLAKILPVSFLLLGVLFFIFIRSVRGVCLFLLPAASLGFAVAFAGITMGSVSGIVIGFGSVVIGITADYAIHVFYAVTTVAGASDPTKALGEVSRPLFIGALTTLAAFAALLFSKISAVSQMAVFAMAGVGAAFLLGLFVLPHCLLARPSPGRAESPDLDKPDRRYVFRNSTAVGIWLAIIVSMVVSAIFVPVSGDIKQLGYMPRSVLADEEKSARLWKTPSDGALVVVKGESGEGGLEKALEANDAVWRLLTVNGRTENAPIISLAPYLPSRKTQTAHHAAWKAFWENRKDGTLAALAPLAAETGFSAGAFQPFADWLESEPEFVTPAKLESFGLSIFAGSLLTRDSEGRNLVYTIVPSGFDIGGELGAALTEAGAEVVSGEHYREDVSEITREDCLKFCLFACIAIGGALYALFRSFSRWALAIFPLASGVLAVTAVFHLFGFAMTVFHAAALPLIMGLAADYGIFMVHSLEKGTLAATEKAVLLSGLTTLASFGTLVLAKHPALYSLGVTVGFGLAVAVFAALWGIPRLGKQASVVEEGR